MKRGSDPPQQPDPLFQFELTPAGLPQRWRNVVHRNRYRARLVQPRAPDPSDNLGEELMQALRQAMQTRMDALPNLQPHDTVHFTMQSDHFSHAFQSTTFTVDEFRRDSARL